ncbi:MAG: TIGR02270 family protein [Proteobacteria bacterium]|nr:TIGR02270 family protein [Pseudomonadota bacterium]
MTSFLVARQYIEEAASLRHTRTVLLRAPHVDLPALAREDQRLVAHLDGAQVAGDAGWQLALAALAEEPGVGPAFTAAVLALQRGDAAALDALVDAPPDAAAQRGLVSALGWLSAGALKGLIVGWLEASQPTDAHARRHRLALATCDSHRLDPGAAWISPATLAAQPGTTRTAARLGRTDLLPAVYAAGDAQAAVLLGDRGAALAQLREQIHQPAALQLHQLAAPPDAARALVRSLATAPDADLRLAIRAAAYAGDTQALPWLIQQMEDPQRARLAGEAFTWITGAELDRLQLERLPTEAELADPREDPANDDVSLDEDDGLPWPDAPRVHAWWQAHRDRLPGPGQRCFMGAPATDVANLQQVLRHGRQRQRHGAALLLTLNRPGTPLFNVAMPAWRQQRLLGLPITRR